MLLHETPAAFCGWDFQRQHSIASANVSSDTLESGPTEDLEPLSVAQAIKDWKRPRAGMRKGALVGQKLARHQAVLGFL